MIWIEKYRPQTLDDVCLTDELRSFFSSFTNEIPHLLFAGPAGTGKTTIARILVNDILKCDYLYINASDENGIDNIRTKVAQFVQTKSFDGKIKVVVFDEADGLTKDSQKCLRNMMEEYSHVARFILTANYKHKISEPLQSRCQSIDIRPTLKGSVKRCLSILKNEGINFTKEDASDIISLVKANYPDLRKSINDIQKYSSSGELKIKLSKNTDEISKYIWENILSSDTIKIRKFLIENEEKFDADYDSILKNLLNYVYTLDIQDLYKKQAIIQIADSLFKGSFVTDKEINAYACILSLESIMN